MKIETGIYRHFTGNLYFVREIITNTDNQGLSVLYNALYPGPVRGFCKSLADFKAVVPDENNNPVQRFVRLMELPVEKMRLLSPGVLVAVESLHPGNAPEIRKVLAVSEACGKISVQLEITPGMAYQLSLPRFLDEKFAFYKSAE